jgi:hypothetical protein
MSARIEVMNLGKEIIFCMSSCFLNSSEISKLYLRYQKKLY